VVDAAEAAVEAVANWNTTAPPLKAAFRSSPMEDAAVVVEEAVDSAVARRRALWSNLALLWSA
jgi:hypothetical protein